MASLIGAYDAARELIEGTDGRASLVLALWGAVLSPNKVLSWNGDQVEALRPYARLGLPRDKRAVWAIIRSGHTFCTLAEGERVLHIWECAQAGMLRGLERMPRSAQEWEDWRYRVAQLPGMSWKTASFAALLMWPFACPLVPVDRHVCDRLDRSDQYKKISAKSKPALERYKALERIVIAERDREAPGVPVCVWHWYKWSEWRQLKGLEPVSDKLESHRKLSPYVR